MALLLGAFRTLPFSTQDGFLSLRSNSLRNRWPRIYYSLRALPGEEIFRGRIRATCHRSLTPSPVRPFAYRGPYREQMLDVSTVSRSEPSHPETARGRFHSESALVLAFSDLGRGASRYRTGRAQRRSTHQPGSGGRLR